MSDEIGFEITSAEIEIRIGKRERMVIRVHDALDDRVYLGRIEIEIPFNAPNDRPCRIFVDDGGDLFGKDISSENFSTCDQYTIQGDVFSRAIRENREAPVPLENAIRNMAVIEAIFRSAASGRWESPANLLAQSS